MLLDLSSLNPSCPFIPVLTHKISSAFQASKTKEWPCLCLELVVLPRKGRFSSQRKWSGWEQIHRHSQQAIIKHLAHTNIHFTHHLHSLPIRAFEYYSNSFTLLLGALGSRLRPKTVPSLTVGELGHRPVQQPGQFLGLLFP